MFAAALLFVLVACVATLLEYPQMAGIAIDAAWILYGLGVLELVVGFTRNRR